MRSALTAEKVLLFANHRGECGRIAWTGCPRCSRCFCENCFGFICCDFADVQKVSDEKTVAPVSEQIETKRIPLIEERSTGSAISVKPLLFRAIALLFLPQDVQMCNASDVSSLQSVPVAVAPVAACHVETKMNRTSSVESDRVKSMTAPDVAAAVENQVECITRRNHMHINVCDRYTSLADLCRVFGLQTKARTNGKHADKNKMATTTKDRSPTSSPAFCSPSNSSSSSSFPADARYKN